VQGHSLDELAFRSQPGLIGSYVGLALNILVLIAQFYVSVAPIDMDVLTTSQRLQRFFSVYLALPVTLAFYFPYKLWFRTSVVRSHNMDLVTGIRELNIQALIEEEREEKKKWPRWKKVYKFFC
jgi:amino acid transporter